MRSSVPSVLWVLSVLFVLALPPSWAGEPAAAAADEEGFVPLFNGKGLTGWAGSVKGYTVEDGVLVCQKKGGGQLYTAKDYANFVLRFDFKLEPGGNNGVALRNPPGAHAAYQGMEIQILDDDHPSYARLAPYQYHGSIYGVVPARRGHLKPAGEWNTEEITADGTKIKVVLNGVTIVDADLQPIIDSGKTLDGRGVKGHPGLLRKTGRIGFIGHGARVEFRGIRLKELK